MTRRTCVFHFGGRINLLNAEIVKDESYIGHSASSSYPLGSPMPPRNWDCTYASVRGRLHPFPYLVVATGDGRVLQQPEERVTIGNGFRERCESLCSDG